MIFWIWMRLKTNAPINEKKINERLTTKRILGKNMFGFTKKNKAMKDNGSLLQL